MGHSQTEDRIGKDVQSLIQAWKIQRMNSFQSMESFLADQMRPLSSTFVWYLNKLLKVICCEVTQESGAMSEMNYTSVIILAAARLAQRRHEYSLCICPSRCRRFDVLKYYEIL